MGVLSRRKNAVVLSGSSPRRKQQQKLAGRIRIAMLLLVGGVLVFAALRHGMKEAARRSVLADMDQIVLASRSFREDFGRCPHDADELAHPPAGSTPYLARPPRDPWGRPYHYHCPGRWRPDEVDVATAGPDGEWDGRDDITTDL